MNNVRLAREPFDPCLSICRPERRAHALAVWAADGRRWRLLEPLLGSPAGQVCAETSALSPFAPIRFAPASDDVNR